MISNENSAYNYPRINARTANTLLRGTEDECIEDMAVELVLDNIFKILDDFLENNIDSDTELSQDDMYIAIKFSGTKESVKMEAISRLQDLGYTVQGNLDSEEELEFMENIINEAEDDPKLKEIYLEALRAEEKFKVSWGYVFENDIQEGGDCGHN